MELLLTNITNWYILLTCVLTVWGMYSVYTLYEVIDRAIIERNRVRRLDILYLCGLSVTTTILICSLYIFVSDVASRFIIHLFIFELWYSLFAIFFTINYLKDCVTFVTSYQLLDEIRSYRPL